MGQIIAIIIIIIMIAFSFIPMALLNHNQFQVGEIKQNLNLSAKALINSIDKEVVNVDNIAEGFNRSNEQEVSINKDKLLREFYDVLFKNYHHEKNFAGIKSRLVVKLLVLHDRFYVANLHDQWSPPFYFTDYQLGKQIYFNTRNHTIYYYDETSEKVYQPMELYGTTAEIKNQLIIDKINSVIGNETAIYREEGQLAIEIRNQESNIGDYNSKYQNFNVLEGITFFVIYQEDSKIEINREFFQYKNYNVVGYTLR